MKHALLELIKIAVRHLDEIPDINRRADLLEAAAETLEQGQLTERADQLRLAVAQLRVAGDAQHRAAQIISSAAKD